MVFAVTNEGPVEGTDESANLARKSAGPVFWCGQSKAYDVLRLVLSGLLLAAAVLKAVDLMNRPVESGVSLSSHPVLSLVIELEMAVGFLLLVGLWKAFVARLSVGLFGSFACVSAYKALLGEHSCGCLGTLQVPPEYMLTVDVVAVILLVVLAPAWQPAWSDESWPALRATVFAGAMLSGTGLLIWSMGYWRAAHVLTSRAQTDVVTHEVGDFVLLKPQEWMGRLLPLMDRIDIGRKLGRGKWAVLLYRSNCDDCSQLIGQYLEKGNQIFGVSGDYQVAVVQVDGNAHAGVSRLKNGPGQGKLVFGKLDSTRRWIVETPVVLILRDGIVVRVRDGTSSS